MTARGCGWLLRRGGSRVATPDYYRSLSQMASAIASAMSWSPKPLLVVAAPAAGRPSELRLLRAGAVLELGEGA